MAANKLLLVDNVELLWDNENKRVVPAVVFRDNGVFPFINRTQMENIFVTGTTSKKIFMTGKSKIQVHDSVLRYLEMRIGSQRSGAEDEHDLWQYIHEDTSDNLLLKWHREMRRREEADEDEDMFPIVWSESEQMAFIKTPIYEFQMLLMNNNFHKTSLKIMGKDTKLVDITSIWSTLKFKILAEQISRYSFLIPQLEALTASSLEYNRTNPILMYKKQNKRMFHLLFTDINGINNPYSWVAKDLQMSDLFITYFEASKSYTAKDPQVFEVHSEITDTTLVVATSYDILRMMGIDCNVSQRFSGIGLTQLIGAKIIDYFGFGEDVIGLPTLGSIYLYADSNGSLVEQSYVPLPGKYSEDDGYSLTQMTRMEFYLQRYLGDETGSNLANFMTGRIDYAGVN